MKIGQLIKMERQKQNMKQEYLAQGICSPSYLSKIESGIATPGEDMQQQLLKKLNISIEIAIENSSPEQFMLFSDRFKEVINQRDKVAADLLIKDIRALSEEHPLHQHKISLLLIEARLMLMTSNDFNDVKKDISVLVSVRNEMSHGQLFHLYLTEGIFAYIENRFTNALHIFTEAYKLSQDYRMDDWEMAELHYVLSLAALSAYRYISTIDHVVEALAYFNAKMLAERSIECLLVLGIAQKRTGKVNDAIVSFENAREIMTNSESSKYLGMSEHNLGACYSLLKDSELALHHFNQSLLAKESPNEQIITILSIVKEHTKIGDNVTAKDWLNKGIAILDRLTGQNKDPYSHHFAILKVLLYDEDDLVPIFESALLYFKDKQNYYHCFVYCNVLAEKLVNRNQFKLATTFYQKAFDYHLEYRKVQYWEELE